MEANRPTLAMATKTGARHPAMVRQRRRQTQKARAMATLDCRHHQSCTNI
jgi:hypothetical protein